MGFTSPWLIRRCLAMSDTGISALLFADRVLIGRYLDKHGKVVRRSSYLVRRPSDLAGSETRSVLSRRENIIQSHVRIPDRKCVARLALLIRVQRPPCIDITIRLHHLDCAARDVAAAQPDHGAYPPRHVRCIEHLARRQRVEVAGENVKREGTLLSYELLLYSVEQTTELAGARPLRPLGEPGAEVQDEKARETVGKRHLEQRVAGP